MLVQQILRDKGGDSAGGDVVTITPDASVGDAAKVLSARRIGALVVSSEGTDVAGILSERDIVRAIGANGPGCLADPVTTLMTADIISATRDETVQSVLAKMTQGRFRHMPVMDNAKMVGLISIGDVVKAQLAELSMEKEALEGMIKGF
ncbi:CBS domain-containing protein [Gymnodinialimonas ceratoperidinii]|uniref:CBS domain-containing protein n=1 Tax=Gymnodinialimonas ceratoperidinii TaxID=2856823 RepID=A0A8F6TVI4_9RHOB|nr:CBS domain-containing protein [Gymnodinialimonas ceratoperidinii]QXT38669.1 CBS domain-containing protein [Gymnodinialimonas ceratoperidinii]